MSKKIFSAMMALGLFALMFSSISAAVTFDPVTGEGFVGKGDVQLALGYNNKQLQDSAGSLVFTAESVTETTWDCRNTNNQNIQERSRTTTIEGVVSEVARVKNQITGFNLVGYSGTPETENEGPAVGSCPSGPWTFVEGSINTGEAGESILYVNGIALQ